MMQIEITAEWEYVADRVMGGVSAGQMTQEMVQGRMATRLCGDVSLENNGGFVQIASDLPDMDASGWDGWSLSARPVAIIINTRTVSCCFWGPCSRQPTTAMLRGRDSPIKPVIW